MTIYNIHYTDKTKSAINIDEQKIDQTKDLTLFGRKKLKYGEQMNENMLHLLEHFSCAEDSLNIGNPNLLFAATDQISNVPFLTNPINGQLWFNSTQDCLFYWNGDNSKWYPVGMYDDIAANWGIIYSGQTLPKPVSSVTGHVFDYSECSWIVSPYKFPNEITYMLCETNSTSLVTSIYSVDGDIALYEGFATYLIVGIRGNHNYGSLAPIPSPTPTPTPTITPSHTTGLTPTPTISAPVPTPTPSPAYVGLLSAAVVNPLAYGSNFKGVVNPMYAGDAFTLKYPGTGNKKYNLLLGSSVPYQPWQRQTDGNYYLYVPINSTDGTPYPTGILYSKTIFVSNDGINGLFYGVEPYTNPSTGVITVGQPISGYYKVKLFTSGNILFGYYNLPPTQTNSFAPLNFSQYLSVYPVGIDYEHNNTPLPAGISIFTINPPSPYLQNFDLFITGGIPPYTITDIRYNPPGNNYPVSAIASGITHENFSSAPVNFRNIDTIKSKYTGVINLSNPNVSPITNGFKITNFLTSDIYYPSNYISVYGTSCSPENLWNEVNNNYNVSTGKGCIHYTGFYTTNASDLLTLEITDSTGALITTNLLSAWEFQNPTAKFSNADIGFIVNVTSGPVVGQIINAAGTYSYTIDLSMANDVSSTYPRVKPSQLRYTFSIVAPTNTALAGSWLYTGASLATLSSSGGACYNTTADTLIHVGESGAYSLNQLIPYNGSTGSVQTINITQYINNLGVPVNISSNPIRVKLYPTSTPNTFVWNALKSDGTNNSLSQSSPLVPYDMKLDVIIPAGIPSAGNILIPVVFAVQDSGGPPCFRGSNGGPVLNFQLNFSTT